MSQTQSKVMGIDYGTKRIGLALNHHQLAEPLMVLPNPGGDETEAVSQLAALLAEHQVTQLVVGLSENKMAEKTKAFMDQLQRYLAKNNQQIAVDYIDETLSSQEMMSRLRQEGVKRSKRRGPIDHFVAAQLLQEWLDAR